MRSLASKLQIVNCKLKHCRQAKMSGVLLCSNLLRETVKYLYVCECASMYDSVSVRLLASEVHSYPLVVNATPQFYFNFFYFNIRYATLMIIINYF